MSEYDDIRLDGFHDGYDKGQADGYDNGYDEAKNYFLEEIYFLKEKHGYEIQEAQEQSANDTRETYRDRVDEYLRIINTLKTELRNTKENYYTLRKEHEELQRTIKKNH